VRQIRNTVFTLEKMKGHGVVAIINVCDLERKMSSYWLRVIEGRARSRRDGILQLTVFRAKLKRLD
jgi:hypothetical protein